MIFSSSTKGRLLPNSPLIRYLREACHYSGEDILFSTRYSAGTFTTTMPIDSWTNCSSINGYPHVCVPSEVCHAEVDAFLSGQAFNDRPIVVRYGDTHPNKPIPKLGQMRNLFLADTIKCLVGNNCTLYFGNGDISIKSLAYIINRYGLNVTPDDLFVSLVNNRLTPEQATILGQVNCEVKTTIRKELRRLGLTIDRFLTESDLYLKQDLYQELKAAPVFVNERKANGELNYSLQEIMVIRTLITDPNTLMINIIGANQSDHITRVLRLLDASTIKGDIRFLTYGMCNNGEENQTDIWNAFLEDFIMKNSLTLCGKWLEIPDLLRLLTIIIPIDSEIDFGNLSVHLPQIRRFCTETETILCCKGQQGFPSAELLSEMALVNYARFRAVNTGKPRTFFTYLFRLWSQFRRETYIGELKQFLITGLKTLGFDEIENRYKS